MSTSRGIACNVLAHEFVHAFDYCRAKVDFENLEHLACTEIRAANLMHCPLMSALSTGEASPWNIKAKHKVRHIRDLTLAHGYSSGSTQQELSNEY